MAWMTRRYHMIVINSFAYYLAHHRLTCSRLSHDASRTHAVSWDILTHLERNKWAQRRGVVRSSHNRYIAPHPSISCAVVGSKIKNMLLIRIANEFAKSVEPVRESEKFRTKYNPTALITVSA